MSWHSMMMADHELVAFRQDIEREYQREIGTGQKTGYTLYGRKRDAGDHVLFVPPEAFHLFERMPSWKSRLRPCDGTPDLTGFRAMSVL